MDCFIVRDGGCYVEMVPEMGSCFDNWKVSSVAYFLSKIGTPTKLLHIREFKAAKSLWITSGQASYARL